MPNFAAWNSRSPSHARAVDRGRSHRDGGYVNGQPFVKEFDCLRLRCSVGQHFGGVGQCNVLGVLHEAVMLGVENVVNRGQADVLIHPSVAGDEMGVEQFVVVHQAGCCRDWPGRS